MVFWHFSATIVFDVLDTLLRFHAAFVLGGLIYEVSWIVRLFNTLG